VIAILCSVCPDGTVPGHSRKEVRLESSSAGNDGHFRYHDIVGGHGKELCWSLCVLLVPWDGRK
jgi:hypothetical protein